MYDTWCENTEFLNLRKVKSRTDPQMYPSIFTFNMGTGLYGNYLRYHKTYIMIYKNYSERYNFILKAAVMNT